MQQSITEPPVYLGFAQSLASSELFRLRSHYLPLGKIGGLPSWLNPVTLPKNEELECGVCKKPLCFLMQVYATRDDDPPHSFHRYLYVFICRNPACSQLQDASNIAVFRCALPRENPYYLTDRSLDPDLDGDIANPIQTETPKLCEICGCYASKKCGKCMKSCCENGTSLSNDTTQNKFLFPEMGIEMDQEFAPQSLFEESLDSDASDGDSDDGEIEQNRRISEFKKFVEQHQEQGDIANNCEEYEEKADKDLDFIRFNRFVELNPGQVLRYLRGGKPLLTTIRAPALPDIIDCGHCGGPRTFEMQLMPHLLSLLGVDSVGQSIDWASVYIYTCANSCMVPHSGYAKEFVVKQDFID
ncbi:unnamed protein product, partial [Mesorhabditis belari]|uniref:MYND-type domain-containing protein n=1 Tax=Mesorhabditis belari TaxID=2138241 RepID=A0AAF3EBH8_9BILA